MPNIDRPYNASLSSYFMFRFFTGNHMYTRLYAYHSGEFNISTHKS